MGNIKPILKRLAVIMSVITLAMGSGLLVKANTAKVNKKITVKAGEIKKIKGVLKLKDGEWLAGTQFYHEPGTTSAVADVSYDDSSDTVYVHGIQEGNVSVQFDISSERKVKLEVKTKGSANKTDKGGYNKIPSINQETKTKNFKYTISYLTASNYKDGKPITYELYTSYLTNVSKKELKPDVTVKFYDKKKKLLGTFTLSKAKGMNIHTTLQPDDIYRNHIAVISADDLGIKQSKFNKIYYWKIV